MSFPPTRGHPLNKNAAVQDFECIMAPLNGGSGCASKKFPCGGYPRDKKIVTTFKAGEVFEVKFFNQNFPELKNEDKQKDQARHNGGLCEFSLSYDGGKTYTVIASYKKLVLIFSLKVGKLKFLKTLLLVIVPEIVSFLGVGLMLLEIENFIKIVLISKLKEMPPNLYLSLILQEQIFLLSSKRF